MKHWGRSTATAAIVIGAVTLAAGSVFTIGAAGNTGDRHACAAPAFHGTVVGATLADGPMTGGPMMNAGNGPIPGGMMRLTLDRTTVAHGNVSFTAINIGNTAHELVVLTLADARTVGTRAVDADARIDEIGSLGEASRTCAAGSGDGIAPDGSGWVTVSLPAGRYEVVCGSSPAASWRCTCPVTTPPACTRS